AIYATRRSRTSAPESAWSSKAAPASRRSTRSAGRSSAATWRTTGRERWRRAMTRRALETIDPARLTAKVAHHRTGGLSGLDILAAWVEHDLLHLMQLPATLARGWATRWAHLYTEYAGPIPYSSA